MKKNNSIEFLRIIFITIICLYHFGQGINFDFISNGYILVEFFFILSGYLLFEHFRNNKSKTGEEFVIKKFKRLIKDYVFALIVSLLATIVLDGIVAGGNILNILITTIPDFFMLQNCGIYTDGLNYPLWYISVFLVGSYFIYTLLVLNKEYSIKIFFPLIILIVYTYIFSKGESLEIWEINNCFYMPLFRGIAAILLGVYTCIFVDKIKLSTKLSTMLEILSMVLVIYCIFSSNLYDKYVLIFMPVLIGCFFKQSGLLSKFFNKEFWSKLSKYAYPMYVNHAIIIAILKVITTHFDINKVVLIISYFIILIIYSICTHSIIGFVEKKKMKLQEDFK